MRGAAAAVAIPFISQRSVASRETVVKVSYWRSADDPSWLELPTREVLFDDIKVCIEPS